MPKSWMLKAPAICCSLLVMTSAAFAQSKVTKAELCADNLEYKHAMHRAVEGQGLLDDPPLAWRSNVFEGRGSINVSGLTTDGQGLFTTQPGQLILVTLDGKATAIAGAGVTISFRQPYDPRKPQTADTVQLVLLRRTMAAGSNVFLAYKDKAIYHCAAGTTPYVERLIVE